MLFHSLLAFRISVEKLADNLMGVSLYDPWSLFSFLFLTSTIYMGSDATMELSHLITEPELRFSPSLPAGIFWDTHGWSRAVGKRMAKTEGRRWWWRVIGLPCEGVELDSDSPGWKRDLVWLKRGMYRGEGRMGEKICPQGRRQGGLRESSGAGVWQTWHSTLPYQLSPWNVSGFLIT